MKLRTKLTTIFVIITAGILFVFAGIIYYSASQDREREFYSLLKKEAITKANLFFDAQVDPETLQDIYIRNREIIHEVEVAIYDKDFNLLYHDAYDIDFVKETREMIDSIILLGDIKFSQQDWQVIGFKFHFAGVDYAITAAAYDDYGYTKLLNLKQTIFIVLIFSIFIIFVSGLFFSKKAFDPIKQMVKKANNITATNLDLRLEAKGTKDELSELAHTFNQMLDRLESSFDSQKHFVSNISHEIRTPLAAIITELELSKNSDRTIEEYKEIIENVLNDAKKMNRLSNSLLDLAKASYDASEISFKPVRIDEIIIDAGQQVQKLNPEYKTNINFESEPDDENQMIINGNEYLLKVAFANIIENSCKFSEEKQCALTISFNPKQIVLVFKDNGVGISDEDLPHIFTPFYRGSNKIHADGNGIGLYLTQKIINLHSGSVDVSSKLNKGTEFTVGISL